MQDRLVEQFFQEMEEKKEFLTSPGFVIKTVEECEEYFQLILDDIEEMISDFESLVGSYACINDLYLKESSKDIEKYKHYRDRLREIIREFEEKLSVINIYLNQVPVPEKPFSLAGMNDFFAMRIEYTDRHINIYKKLEFVPNLDIWLKEIYRSLEKYNQYIDIINRRNMYVKKYNKKFFKAEIPIIDHIENLKNWSPESIKK